MRGIRFPLIVQVHDGKVRAEVNRLAVGYTAAKHLWHGLQFVNNLLGKAVKCKCNLVAIVYESINCKN